MGRPQPAVAAACATRAPRPATADALYGVIGDWVARYTADDLTKLLNEADIPASPLMSIADIAADPHYRERGTLVDVRDPEFGELLMPAPLPRLSKTPGTVRSTGPALGAHNTEVYQGVLGLSEREIAALRADGVI
ncbi:CoA transferase [Streptomyces parvus]|uniref:CoA transferase n=1 Tax=Streptomyces parvus TaxID=66428 RepID=UPI00368DFABC